MNNDNKNETKVLGLRCSILVCKEYEGKDFSNYGISSWAKEVIIIGDEVVKAHAAVHPVSAVAPAVVIRKRNIGGKVYVHAEPVHGPYRDAIVGPMAGGTHIFSNDSRFSQITGVDYPISLHDRWETPEQYRMNSI